MNGITMKRCGREIAFSGEPTKAIENPEKREGSAIKIQRIVRQRIAKLPYRASNPTENSGLNQLAIVVAGGQPIQSNHPLEESPSNSFTGGEVKDSKLLTVEEVYRNIYAYLFKKYRLDEPSINKTPNIYFRTNYEVTKGIYTMKRTLQLSGRVTDEVFTSAEGFAYREILFRLIDKAEDNKGMSTVLESFLNVLKTRGFAKSDKSNKNYFLFKYMVCALIFTRNSFEGIKNCARSLPCDVFPKKYNRIFKIFSGLPIASHPLFINIMDILSKALSTFKYSSRLEISYSFLKDIKLLDGIKRFLNNVKSPGILEIGPGRGYWGRIFQNIGIKYLGVDFQKTYNNYGFGTDSYRSFLLSNAIILLKDPLERAHLDKAAIEGTTLFFSYAEIEDNGNFVAYDSIIYYLNACKTHGTIPTIIMISNPEITDGEKCQTLLSQFFDLIYQSNDAVGAAVYSPGQTISFYVGRMWRINFLNLETQLLLTN